MAVSHEEISSFLIGQLVSPTVQAEIESQFDDPQSAASIVSRRLAIAARRFADPDGPLLTALAPPFDFTFDQLTEINTRCAEFQRNKQWDDAYPLRLTTCRLALRFLGEDHRDTATYVNSLGRILYERREYDRAQHVYEHAIELRTKYFGERHSDTSISWAGFGRVLEAKAEYDDARECHRFALEVMEENFGPNHPDTGVSLSDLGCVSLTLGDFVTAETCFQRAAEIAKDIEGADDPIHAGALMHLGTLREATHNLAEAECLYQEALTIYEYVYGSDHPDVAWCLDYLGGLRLQRSELPAAREMFQRAAEILATVEHSPMLQMSVLSNLAVVLHLHGSQTKAGQTYRKALKICRKFFGKEHPTTLMFERNLALLDENRQATRRVIVQPTYLPTNGQVMLFFRLTAAA